MTCPQRTVVGERIETLVRRMQPRLDGVLRRHSIPLDDADDVLQECLLAMLRQWPMIERPEAWLIAALRNRCLMFWRSQVRRRWRLTDDGDLEALISQRRSILDGEPRQEIELRCQELIDRLPELPRSYQRLLQLRFGCGLRPIEVAEVLGYRPSGISTTIGRASSAWRRKVEGHRRRRPIRGNCDGAWPPNARFDAGTVEVF